MVKIWCVYIGARSICVWCIDLMVITAHVDQHTLHGWYRKDETQPLTGLVYQRPHGFEKILKLDSLVCPGSGNW